MPIQDRDDAHEVEARIKAIFAASSPDQRARELRRLFVEVLDFDSASGQVPLRAASAGVTLPGAAERIASLDGVNVCYVALDITGTDRVRRAEAATAAKLIADQLGEDLLLLFTNTSCSQMHFIHPTFEHAQPTLRRMVVERDLPRRTAVQQVAKIYWKCQKSGSIRAALETAFDVEPVTKRFFQEYKRIFNAAETQVSGFGPAEDEDKRLFVQTLFNRLMFVYFLSRKGWLTFGGDKDYLNALWRDYEARPTQTNFYGDRLYHLFFFGLNHPGSQDVNSNFKDRFMSEIYGDVPFLNGGLFEETVLDERDDITVPDGAVEPVLRELFDSFNFTVMESTPFDIEVAVDPEMLGKVFEELINERHETGAYYTPRPVVSFMCREALKGHLEGRDTGLSSEAVAVFVDQRDTTGISLAAAHEVSAALDEVTVVDPACGSGAYLLGMLHELVDLQTTLYNVRTDPRSLYELKLHIIERNLYGVDIDEFAVNIAMLRMWLSLAIEYEGEQPESLPNLDFKIVCGDSLLGPDPNPDLQGDLFTEQIQASNLGHLKAQYMRESDANVKSALKAKIEDIHDQLSETLGGAAVAADVLDWRIAFAEVFATGGGFDVVVADPPYVVIKSSQLRTMYKDGIYGRMNLYGLFIQRSIQLLSDGSQLAFINPKTLLADKYFMNLRRVIKNSCELKGVVLISDRHNTFERVLQECIILHLARKMKPSSIYLLAARSISIPSDLNNAQDKISITSDRVMLGGDYNDCFYIGESGFDYRVFESMNSAGVKLASLGIKAETGKIQFDRYQEYAQPTSANNACRLMWAENIQRYALRPSNRRVGKEWLSNQIMAVVIPNIMGQGIVTQRVSANEQPRRIIATLLRADEMVSGRIYSENHTNFIPLQNSGAGAIVIASLNSSLMEYIFRRLNSNTQVSAGEINQLPFPAISG